MNVLETIELEDSAGVVVTLEVLAEDSQVRGNVMASGDDEEDRKCEDNVLDEYDHNSFAWCTLHVVAKLAGSPEIYGDDFLGQVSILEKFLVEGQTLESAARQMVDDYDMIANAKAELGRAISGVEQSISEFNDAQAIEKANEVFRKTGVVIEVPARHVKQ